MTDAGTGGRTLASVGWTANHIIAILLLAAGCKSPATNLTHADAAMLADHGSTEGERLIGEDESLCQQSCAVLANTVCPDQQQPGCIERCESMLMVPSCVAEIRAIIACGIAGGVATFECDERNRTVYRAGHCTTEQSLLIACLRSDGGT